VADESYVDDQFFGYDINALHRAISPTMPEYERMFYSGSQQGSGEGAVEYQETPAPDSPEAMGADIRSIYLQLKGEQSGVADDLADHWANVWRLLLQTQTQLRNQTTAMAEGWESPHAKKIFLNEVGKLLAYLEVWMDAANTSSTTLRGLAIVMREAWAKMEKLWARWVHAVGVSVTTEELAGKIQGGNHQRDLDRKAGMFGDDYRTYEENLKAYSKEAAILASETASKYAPLLANLESARAVMLTPLNGRLHPVALGQPAPDLSGPGGLPPGGLPPGPGELPPGGLPPSPPPLAPPLGKDKPTPPDPDELKKFTDEKPPTAGDLPPVPDGLTAPTPGPLPQVPPLTVPQGLGGGLPPGPLPGPLPNANALRNGPALPTNVPSLLPNANSVNDLTALTNMSDQNVPVAGGGPDTSTLSNSLFPPGTIAPPPGGMPNPPQQGKVIGGKGTPGVPGSQLGAPPPSSAQGNPQQQAKSGPRATTQAGEVPTAFQVPPAATPSVLGERKDTQRRTPPPAAAAHSTPGLGGTPPVLANPRQAGQAKPKPLPPRLRKAVKPDSDLVADVPTGTAPVLDGRTAQPVTTGPAADVPAALLGHKPAPSTPDKKKARPVFHADRRARVPQKADPAKTETPATPANAWEVETPGGPVVAGGSGSQPAR
jgi:hypothetical protein